MFAFVRKTIQRHQSSNRGLLFSIYSITLLLIYLPLFGQQAVRYTYPSVGKICPSFILKNIYYGNYDKKVRLEDFKGKYLILDFWDKNCTTCFASFPKLSQLQKEFKGNLNIILVGYDDGDNSARNMFERFRTKLNLSLSVSYDSALFKKFGIFSVPHVLWVDQNSFVRAITGSHEVNEGNIKLFLQNELRNLAVKTNEQEELAKRSLYDYNKPFLTDGNGGEDTSFMQRSLFAEWKRNQPISIPAKINSFSNYYVQVIGANIIHLYNLAYTGCSGIFFSNPIYGNTYPFPIFEISDSLILQSDNNGRNIFSYSLFLRKDRDTGISQLMKVMQQDLFNFFGFTAFVEKRKMPCWKLIANKGAINQLRAKDRVPFGEVTPLGLTVHNVPIRAVLGIIWSRNQLDFPFIDATGINENIDINIEALMTDLTQVKKALVKYGLDLVKGEKEMKVIVVRDKKS